MRSAWSPAACRGPGDIGASCAASGTGCAGRSRRRSSAPVLGAWLLLHLPEKVFTKVVPVLLVAGAGSGGGRSADPGVGAPARRGSRPVRRARQRPADGRVGVRPRSRSAIYGGYFTAAQGILLIGAMGALLPEDMQRMNAAKNLLSLVVNIVAAVAYTLVAFDRISWAAAGLIAVGSLVGGFLGAHYGRRLSPNALRAVDRRGRPDRAVSAANRFRVAASAVCGRLSTCCRRSRRTAGCGAVW